MLIDDPGRFDGMRVIGIDERVWRHTRRGEKYVTVIIDLTAVHAGTRPARLLTGTARATRSTGRRRLHTGADLLTDKQAARLRALFAADAHVEVWATWGIYQRMIAAYHEPDRAAADS
ncbi:hypothetical protein [Rhodococcus jostii]|uniref:hypothetical protein n=1 Tax=Rhodococcus jostii TaxID=132919 RepID=UPI000AA322E4